MRLVFLHHQVAHPPSGRGHGRDVDAFSQALQVQVASATRACHRQSRPVLSVMGVGSFSNEADVQSTRREI